MKRTGIFATTAAGALGATALVGGVGYTLAQDVAEQTGTPLDLGAVASVEPGEHDAATSSTDATDDGASSEDAPPAEAPDDGDTGAGAGPDTRAGGAAPVAPAPPVAIEPGAEQPSAPARTEPDGDGYGDGRADDDRDGWDGDGSYGDDDGWDGDGGHRDGDGWNDDGGGDGWSGDGDGWSGDGGRDGGYGGHDGGYGGHH